MTSTSLLRGERKTQVYLAPYTTWRVGGRANVIYRPQDTEDLCRFLSKMAMDEPLLWLGLGSNILIRDGGFPGTVIRVQGRLTQINCLTPTRLRAEAGVPCPVFARFCARYALKGAEFLVGIPGTLGGALAMNAGCLGQEIWDLVTDVETVNQQGKIIKRPRSAWQVSYRNVNRLKHEWFLAAEFQLQLGNRVQLLALMQEILAHRVQTQPIGQRNCGSVFKNPGSLSAGDLIERCGLKGERVGGAVVSTQHANFILNEGRASSADIEALIFKVAEKVFQVHQVQLHPEVCIYGIPCKIGAVS